MTVMPGLRQGQEEGVQGSDYLNAQLNVPFVPLQEAVTHRSEGNRSL